ncbi:hypothetical protein NDU88_002914 [Pleurodeles waltl]|uniref:Uncharacterized protein n=1 Tax=Pleurodeles waltl TaxID=8319 RepID=A0AAV7MX24_PLEWA|nr:hypothetical protein NDU88_002914 [Pleurodeles waltl]
MHISPKLEDFAKKEPSEDPKGYMFGVGLVKGVGKYVFTSTSLDKAEFFEMSIWGHVFDRPKEGDLSLLGLIEAPITNRKDELLLKDFSPPLDSILKQEEVSEVTSPE